MKSKRICFVIAAFSDGGVSRVVSNLANEFIDRGIDVDVVALVPNYYTSKRQYASEVNLISLGGPRILSFILLWRYFMQNRDYDAIISAIDFVNVHTMLASKMARVRSKVIVTTHTNLSEEKRQISSKILKVVYRLASSLYPLAENVCAVSSGVATSMHEELGLRGVDIQVIYNPIVHKEMLKTVPDRPHLWYSEKIPVIIGCGRLTKQKNFKQLINAFSKLTQHQKVRLILLGDGQLKDELVQQVEVLGLSEYVYFAGNVVNPLDYFYYSRMLVVSSLWEGFGNIIVEALSMGCPVVSTDCPSGPSEILENGKWGRLVETNNEAALYQAMLEELSDQQVSKSFLQKRASDFTVNDIAEKYLSLVYSEDQGV